MPSVETLKRAADNDQLQPHYHIHYHCPCHEHNHHHQNQPFNSQSFANLLPPSFPVGGTGTTRIQWSRHTTPDSKGATRVQWARYTTTKGKKVGSSNKGKNNTYSKTKENSPFNHGERSNSSNNFSKDRVYNSSSFKNLGLRNSPLAHGINNSSHNKGIMGLNNSAKEHGINRSSMKRKPKEFDSSPKSKAITSPIPVKNRQPAGLRSSTISPGANSSSRNRGVVTSTKIRKPISSNRIRKSSNASSRSRGFTSPTKAQLAREKETLSGGQQRMGKTKTETTTRTYTKDGQRFEEVVETVTKEDDHGNITRTTKTTTRTLDPYSTKDMAKAIDGAKKSKGRRSSSSSSSSDSSPDRKTKEKNKTADKPGLLSKLRSKVGKSSDSDSSDDEDFVEDVHKSINQYRVKHGVSKLKLNKEMNKYAKEWAKKMAADEKMSHRPDSKYGENVFCMSSNMKTFKVNGKDIVERWYNESKNHTFGEEPKGTTLKAGHFTQMVWKDSRQLGVGKARSAAGTKIFVVANFDPQGNWMGQFADQVPPVGGFPKSASKDKPSLFSRTRKSSSSDSESSSDEEDFAEDCVKAHNNYRKKHGAPPLKLSKNLNKFAKEWAQTIAKKDMLEHRSNNNYGENLYVAWSSNPKHMIKAAEAVDSWYSEIKDFTFGREPSDLRAGHFTQVVWQDSKELGVAIARSKSNKLYVVCNYSPAGNYVGSFASKVQKAK